MARTKRATIHTLINAGDTSRVCHCGGVGTRPFGRICVRVSRNQGHDKQVHPPRLGFRQDLMAFGKTPQGSDPIAGAGVGPAGSHRAALSQGSGGQSQELLARAVAPADPLRYATNYSTRINDFAAKGEMT